MLINRVVVFVKKNMIFSRYLFVSIVVTIFDVLIVMIMRNWFNTGIVTANTVGVVSGSVLQYFLVSRHVFYMEYGVEGVLVFFGTFLFGLLLADWVIWFSNRVLPYSLDKNVNLLISKGFSIVIPFFILYGIRKYLFDLLKRRNGEVT